MHTNFLTYFFFFPQIIVILCYRLLFSSNAAFIETIFFFQLKKSTEVRQEAVQQALAALKNRPKPNLPMPSKRSSVLNRSPDRDRDDSGRLSFIPFFLSNVNILIILFFKNTR